MYLFAFIQFSVFSDEYSDSQQDIVGHSSDSSYASHVFPRGWSNYTLPLYPQGFNKALLRETNG